MARPALFHILRIALLGLLLWGGVPALDAHAQKHPPAKAKQQAGLSPRQAAARARAAHGGEVLKVVRKGKGYRVRLLLDSGRVITVTVED